MALQNVQPIIGFVGGGTFETKGVILDLSTFEPLVFGINPTTMSDTKTGEFNDRKVPGRHAPKQEPVAGGPERLTLELMFVGGGQLLPVATKAAVSFLQSLMFPDRGGVLDVLFGPVGAFDRRGEAVGQVGHKISLTFGLWIIEREYRVRSVTTVSGPGRDPITLLPYFARSTVLLQEDEDENIDYLERRFGLPGGGLGF